MKILIVPLIIAVLVPVVSAAERALHVPTDANATYLIIESGGKWPNRIIVTKRTGSSGTSYSKRLYNCANQTVKYLGTGDSLAELAKSVPDPKMGPIVERSIAYYAGQQACKR